MLLILLPFSPLPAQLARTIDSLEKVLADQKPDTNRVNTLYYLARYTKNRNTEKAIAYATEELALSQKLNFQSGKVYAYNVFGIIYQDKGQFNTALAYLDSSLQLANATGDRYAVAISENNIGLVYMEQGLYDRALPHLIEAAKFREKIGDKRGQAGSYNNIGLLYEYTNDHKKAIENYEISLNLKRQLKDKQGMGNTYLNIGLSYSGLNDTAKEKENYRKALDLYEEIGDLKGSSMVYNNLGEIYSAEQQDSLALDYLGKAYAMRKALDDMIGMAQSGTNIAKIYIRTGRLEEAQQYLEKSIANAREGESNKELALAFEALSELYVKKGEFKLALEAYRQSAAAKDSLFNEESDQHIKEMQAKYDTEKKEKEIVQLQAETERKDFLVEKRNLQIAMLIIAAIVLMTAGWFFFTRYKARQQQLKELAVLETKHAERIRIARDMHDDIGSGLSRISMLSEQIKSGLQNNPPNGQSDKTLKVLGKLATESRQLTGSIGEIIWTMSPKNDTLEGLVSYMRNYAYDYLEQAGIECTIDFPDEIPGISVSAELRRNVFLSVKESLHNIVKHSGSPTATLMLKIYNNESFTLSISDRGKGLGTSQRAGSGNGLVNLKKRIEDCGGAFRMETTSNGGVTVILEQVPLQNTTKV